MDGAATRRNRKGRAGKVAAAAVAAAAAAAVLLAAGACSGEPEPVACFDPGALDVCREREENYASRMGMDYSCKYTTVTETSGQLYDGTSPGSNDEGPANLDYENDYANFYPNFLVDCTIRLRPNVSTAAEDGAGPASGRDPVLLLNFTHLDVEGQQSGHTGQYQPFETVREDAAFMPTDGITLYDSTGKRFWVNGLSGNLTGLVVALPWSAADVRFIKGGTSRWGGWVAEYSLVPMEDALRLNGLLRDNATLQAAAETAADAGGVFPGNLVVAGGNVTDLKALAGLREVQGSLKILETGLTALEGLQNLTVVEGDLEISNNFELEMLDGLQSLASVGGNLIVSNNIELTSLDGIQNLASVGSFIITGIQCPVFGFSPTPWKIIGGIDIDARDDSCSEEPFVAGQNGGPANISFVKSSMLLSHSTLLGPSSVTTDEECEPFFGGQYLAVPGDTLSDYTYYNYNYNNYNFKSYNNYYNYYNYYNKYNYNPNLLEPSIMQSGEIAAGISCYDPGSPRGGNAGSRFEGEVTTLTEPRGQLNDGIPPYDYVSYVDCTIRLRPNIPTTPGPELVLLLNFKRFELGQSISLLDRSQLGNSYLWLSNPETGEGLPFLSGNLNGLVVALPWSAADLRFIAGGVIYGAGSDAFRGWAAEYSLVPMQDALRLNGLLHDNATLQAAADTAADAGGVFPGNLVVAGGNVTDLEALTGLRGVQGSLKILETGLTALEGLQNLTVVEGDLEISNNFELEMLDGLQSLASVGGNLIVSSNNKLSTLEGFEGLVAVTGQMGIFDNPNLSSVIGMKKMVRLGSLSIEDNSFVGAGIIRIGNPSFQVEVVISITGNAGLHSVSLSLQSAGSILVSGNERGVTVGESFDFEVGVENDEELQKSSDQWLRVLYGNLAVERNEGLESFTLRGIKSVAGFLSISSNSNLRQVRFFSLTDLCGNFGILANEAIASVTGFPDLFAVHGELQIEGNNKLRDIDFPNLTYVGRLDAAAGTWYFPLDNSTKVCLCLEKFITYTNYGGLSVLQNKELVSVKADKLAFVAGSFAIDGNKDPALNLPLSGMSEVTYKPLIERVSFSACDGCYGSSKQGKCTLTSKCEQIIPEGQEALSMKKLFRPMCNKAAVVVCNEPLPEYIIAIIVGVCIGAIFVLTVSVVLVEIHRLKGKRSLNTAEMVGLLAMTTLSASDFATDVAFLIQAWLAWKKACQGDLPIAVCKVDGTKAFGIAVAGLVNLASLFMLSWWCTVAILGGACVRRLLFANTISDETEAQKFENEADGGLLHRVCLWLSRCIRWGLFSFTRLLTVFMLGFDLEILKVLPWDDYVLAEQNPQAPRKPELERSNSDALVRSRRLRQLSKDEWEGFPTIKLTRLGRSLAAFEDVWQLVLQILWLIWFENDDGIVQGALINVLSLVFTLMHLVVKCGAPVYFWYMYGDGMTWWVKLKRSKQIKYPRSPGSPRSPRSEGDEDKPTREPY